MYQYDILYTMKEIIKGRFKSFKYALNGIKTVLKEEKNFQIEIVFAVLVIFLGLFLKVTSIEFSLLVVACIFVLSGEMVNTAIEDLCDKVEPSFNPVIGKIKDIMAGFVLITSFGAIILGLIILLPKILCL